MTARRRDLVVDEVGPGEDEDGHARHGLGGIIAAWPTLSRHGRRGLREQWFPALASPLLVRPCTRRRDKF